jgi:hypothetical protein
LFHVNNELCKDEDTDFLMFVTVFCVYDTVVLTISNETVYARFAPFGNILKILIF